MDLFDEKMENVRQVYLAIGEAIDAWRLLPRCLVAAYVWGLCKVSAWFMSIPIILSPDKATILLDGPTTQQAAFVSTIVGMGAVIFGFYTNSGRDWGKGVVTWKKMVDPTKVRREVKPEVVAEPQAEAPQEPVS